LEIKSLTSPELELGFGRIFSRGGFWDAPS